MSFTFRTITDNFTNVDKICSITNSINQLETEYLGTDMKNVHHELICLFILFRNFLPCIVLFRNLTHYSAIQVLIQ